MAFMPEGITWTKYVDKKENENIQKMKTKRSQNNWLFSFKGGDEVWQCLNQERQTTSLSGSPSALLRGLGCILMESGAPRHTLCCRHAKLCLVPRPLQILSQLSAIVCLALQLHMPAPPGEIAVIVLSCVLDNMELLLLNSAWILCHCSHEEMLWDQTREACYSVECSDFQKSLLCFTRILFMWAPRECLPAPVIVEVPLELVCVCLNRTVIHFRRCFFSDLAQSQIYDPKCKDLTLSVD